MVRILQYKTKFISNKTLLIEGFEADINDEIIVEQRTTGGSTLSSTEAFIYEAYPVGNSGNKPTEAATK